MAPFPSLRAVAEEARTHRSPFRLALDADRGQAAEAQLLAGERKVPPEEALDYLAGWLADRIDTGEDAIVVVTGPRGRGKSTLTGHLTQRVAKLLRRKLVLKDALLYTRPRLAEFFVALVENLEEESNRGQIGWVDEGGRVFFSRDFATTEQKALMRLLTQIREAGALLFICLPNIRWLDVVARADLACLWVTVRKKGLGRVHVRDNTVRYSPSNSYGFTVNPACPLVAWDRYPKGSRFWYGEYLPLKRAALRDSAHETLSEVVGERGLHHDSGTGRLRHPLVTGETREARARRLDAERQRNKRAKLKRAAEEASAARPTNGPPPADEERTRDGADRS